MSKIILFFILIINLNAEAVIVPPKMENIIVKAECANLFKDYAYFYAKSKESNSELKTRWTDICKVYRENFIKCNTLDINKTNISEKIQFYAPNPLNKVRLESHNK